MISTVNASEAIAKHVGKGAVYDEAVRAFTELEVIVVDFDYGLALAAAELKSRFPRADLSFADRACLALAKREGAVALTGDRAWASLADVGRVELIR